MTYQDICGNAPRVWFELGERKRDKVQFLKWAKSLGCLWLSGEKIHPHASTGAHYISMHKDGRIAVVGMWSWVAWHRQEEQNRTKIIDIEEWKKIIKYSGKQVKK